MSTVAAAIEPLTNLLAVLAVSSPADAKLGRALIKLRRHVMRLRNGRRDDPAARRRLATLVEYVPRIAERCALDDTNRSGIFAACDEIGKRLRADDAIVTSMPSSLKRPPSPESSSTRPKKIVRQSSPAVADPLDRALSDAALLRTLAMHPRRLSSTTRPVSDIVDELIRQARDVSDAQTALRDQPWPDRRDELWRRCEALRPRSSSMDAAFDAAQAQLKSGPPLQAVTAMVDLLAKLCAPARDDAVMTIRQLMAADELDATVNALLQLMGDMRADRLRHSALVLTNGGHLSADDALRREAQARERAAVTAVWGDAESIVAAAWQWTSKSGASDLLSALLGVVFSSEAVVPPSRSSSDGLPAIFALAASDIFALQNSTQLAVLAAAFHALAPRSSVPRILALLKAEATRSADDADRLLVRDLAAELNVSVDAVRRIVRGRDDPVYKLLAERLRAGLDTFARSPAIVSLRSGRSPLASSPAPAVKRTPIAGFTDPALAATVGELQDDVRELWLWTRETWLDTVDWRKT